MPGHLFVCRSIAESPSLTDLLASELRGRERWGRSTTLLGKFDMQQGCLTPELAEAAVQVHIWGCDATICIILQVSSQG